MITETKAYKLRELIVKASASLSDSDALDGMELYDYWEAGIDYEMDWRIRHPINGEDKLFHVRQAHTSSNLYPPGSQGSEALYDEVERPGQGDTPDNPIPYNNNMELFEGKYYSQNDVTYICFRSTGAPVYNNLADLIEIYVRVWSDA